MKIFAALIVIGPLMLTGAGPATAADRDNYSQQAQHGMQEWQAKLHDFAVTVEAKGKEAGMAAEHESNLARTKAEAASRRVQAAGDDGWESARSSFDAASDELAANWRKILPDGK